MGSSELGGRGTVVSIVGSDGFFLMITMEGIMG
jgi:hypothetical protein